MHKAFVYCWTDRFTNKLYVGSHKGNPSDGYVCSSKPMKQEYKKRPQDFTRQIIAEGDYQNMRKLEEKILVSVDAAHDPMFYNQHNSNNKWFCNGHSEQTKLRMKTTNGNDNFSNRSIETKKQWAQKGGLRSIQLGNGFKKFTKEQQSELASRNTNIYEQIICPHCNKIGNKPNMQRWHFDNCKKR